MTTIYNNQYDTLFITLMRDINVQDSIGGTTAYRLSAGMQFKWLQKYVATASNSSCASCNKNKGNERYLVDAWAYCGPDTDGFIVEDFPVPNGGGLQIPLDAAFETPILNLPPIFTNTRDYYASRTKDTTLPVNRRPAEQLDYWFEQRILPSHMRPEEEE